MTENITFFLIDPETDTVIRELSATDTILTSEIGNGVYNLQAVYADGTVGSVRFFRDGVLFKNENNAPYAALGDSGGDYNSVDLPPDGTTETIEIRVYSDRNGGGTLLETRSYVLSYDDSSASAPDAQPDAYAATEDTLLTVPAVDGVLDNDSDPEDDPITAILATGPANGSVNLASDGSFTYTPDADFFGVDSFTYRANDGAESSAPTTVTITVAGVNDAPVVASPIPDQAAQAGVVFSYVVPAGVFSDPDGDTLSLTATLADGSALPSWLSFDSSSQTFSGTPPVGDVGDDLDLRVVAEDGDTETAIDLFTLAITAEPVSPISLLLIDPDTDLVVRELSATDMITSADLGNGVYNLQAVYADGTVGSVRFFRDGVLFKNENNAPYAALGDSGGDYNSVDLPPNGTTETIEIRVYSDSNGTGTLLETRSYDLSYGEETSTSAPDVVADSYVTDSDTALVISALDGVLSNDSDPEDDPITAILFSDADNGTVSLNSDGSFVYTPDADFRGVDSFSYRASDGSNTSLSATVTIDVVPYATREWTANSGFDTTESAQFSTETGDVYVSNALTGTDGYISRINTNGSIVDINWIEGLNNPKGIAFAPGVIYIATASGLVVADLATGEIQETWSGGEGVEFNDVSVGTDGTVYATHHNSNEVWSLTGGVFSVFATSESIESANGILAEDDRLLVASHGNGVVYAIDLATQETSFFSNGYFRPDGIVRIEDGKYLISNFRGEIFLHEEGVGNTEILDIQSTYRVADIGYDVDTSTIYVPTFGSDTVFAYDLELGEPDTNLLVPVVVDLGGDGISYITDVSFDYDDDGSLESGVWAGAEEGILALDRNGNGLIDSGAEIAFVDDLPGAETDLEGLAAYDANDDQTLSGAELDDFFIWVDTNSDGVSDPGELSTLADLAITEIALESDNIEFRDDSGALIVGTSSATQEDGQVIEVADVMFPFWQDEL